MDKSPSKWIKLGGKSKGPLDPHNDWISFWGARQPDCGQLNGHILSHMSGKAYELNQRIRPSLAPIYF